LSPEYVISPDALEQAVGLREPLGDRDPELQAVADLLLEGEPDILGEPLPVKLFRGVLDCVELVDALLELDTVELCDEFRVSVLCTV